MPLAGKRKNARESGAVAEKLEILQFLTGLLRGDLRERSLKNGIVEEQEPSLKERLRAAELLAKGCGAFTEAAPPEPEKETLWIEIVTPAAQEQQAAGKEGDL